MSGAAADLASPARLAKPHRRAVTPAHNQGKHAAAAATRKRGTAASHRSSTSRRSAQGRATRHGRAVRRIAEGPVAEPVVLRSRHRLIAVSPLIGSSESLARQNEMADAEGLERILDEDDLADRIAQKLLVPVPVSAQLAINDNLPDTHKYCRPWTADFLGDLAKAHAARFGHAIQISSAVRTVEYQKQLMMTNGNAAAAEGDIVSPHLTGATVDVAKSGMNRAELNWMRSWLMPLQVAGMIDVEEEFRQRCFHITVYKNYATPPPPASEEKQARKHRPGPSQVASRDL
ncbi:hypothetical protein DYQ86_14940 [Acidobacteria bacterium AB60]|nr:hypothetical protein DYQ86_14940 [Acidobacteria bacterium AB60]